jgi:hypothetical protein
MAYNNYLLKIGNYTVPAKYIRAKTYSAYVNMQDVDPWTDADGYVHRNAIKLKALKIEFETVPMLTNSELESFLSSVRNNYISADERTFNVTAYIPETDSYVTQKAYLADFTPVMYGTYGGVIHYEAIRFAIVGGVA